MLLRTKEIIWGDDTLNPLIVLRHVAPMAAVLLFTSGILWADTLTINASNDARITDPNGSGTFTSVDASNITDSVRDFPNIVIERSVVEFSLLDLGSLPAKATITDVRFQFVTQSIANGTSTTVNILGYKDSTAAITTSDATTSATSLASYQPVVLGLGTQSVSLGTTGVSLLSSLSPNSFFALRFQGTVDTNTQFYSVKGANELSVQGPELIVTYTTPTNAVPEPSTFALLGLGGIGMVFRVYRRRTTAA